MTHTKQSNQKSKKLVYHLELRSLSKKLYIQTGFKPLKYQYHARKFQQHNKFESTSIG